MNSKQLRKLGLMLALAGGAMALFASVYPRTGYAQIPGKSSGAGQNDTHAKRPGGAPGAPPSAPAPPAASSAALLELDTLSYDSSESADKTGITVLHKWVYTYTKEKTTISGTTARLNRKTDTLDTDDPVTIDDEKHHITADKAHVDHAEKNRKLRLIILTGNVVMVLKPDTSTAAGAVAPAAVDPPPGAPGSVPGVKKTANASAQQPGGQAATKEPTQQDTGDKPDNDRDRAKKQKAHGGTATCDKLEYKQTQKISILTGHVVFTQHFFNDEGKKIDRKMTCEHAENDDKANVFHLFKPVHYEDSENQTLETEDDVFIGTKDGEETLTLGHAKITFQTQSDEEEDNGKTDAKAAPDKGAKKPPK